MKATRSGERVQIDHMTVSRDVAIASGIFEDKEGTEPGKVSRVVFNLNGSYTGYAKRAIWKWLDKAGKDT